MYTYNVHVHVLILWTTDMCIIEVSVSFSWEYLRCEVKPRTRVQLISGISEFWSSVTVDKCSDPTQDPPPTHTHLHV